MQLGYSNREFLNACLWITKEKCSIKLYGECKNRTKTPPHIHTHPYKHMHTLMYIQEKNTVSYSTVIWILCLYVTIIEQKQHIVPRVSLALSEWNNFLSNLQFYDNSGQLSCSPRLFWFLLANNYWILFIFSFNKKNKINGIWHDIEVGLQVSLPKRRKRNFFRYSKWRLLKKLVTLIFKVEKKSNDLDVEESADFFRLFHFIVVQKRKASSGWSIVLVWILLIK